MLFYHKMQCVNFFYFLNMQMLINLTKCTYFSPFASFYNAPGNIHIATCESHKRIINIIDISGRWR